MILNIVSPILIFSPMVVEHESSLPASIVQGLRQRGHETEDTGGAGSVVQVNTGL